MGAPAETEPKPDENAVAKPKPDENAVAKPKPDENAVAKPVKKEPTGIMASGVKYLADFPDIAAG